MKKKPFALDDNVKIARNFAPVSDVIDNRTHNEEGEETAQDRERVVAKDQASSCRASGEKVGNICHDVGRKGHRSSSSSSFSKATTGSSWRKLDRVNKF